MHSTLTVGSALALAFAAGVTASADIRITEYMYSGSGGEFIELTNVGNAPVDMTGWSYDDDSRIPGEFDLSPFGIVQPGETVIFTEDPAEVFRADWGLAPETKIIGDLGLPNGNGLGRNDALVLFNSEGVIIDQLIYGDQDFPGSIRTQGASGWVVATGVAQDDPYTWNLSTVSDAQDSYQALTGQTGNPGAFAIAKGELPADLPAIVITEYMYGGGDEFIEFTNISDTPVDVSGWSFDDNNFGNGYVQPFDISAFGTIMPGESVILTEADAKVFRLNWNLAPEVKIIGNYAAGNGANIGRNDEINIYDQNEELVDRLTYGDQDFPGSFRTQGVSASTTPEFLGLNDIYQWTASETADDLDSLFSANGDLGNPGKYFCTSITGDLNGDGQVNAADLGILLAAFGNNDAGDLDNNGITNAADLGILLAVFGDACN